jgi:hypothetical protein
MLHLNDGLSAGSFFKDEEQCKLKKNYLPLDVKEMYSKAENFGNIRKNIKKMYKIIITLKPLSIDNHS